MNIMLETVGEDRARARVRMLGGESETMIRIAPAVQRRDPRGQSDVSTILFIKS